MAPVRAGLSRRPPVAGAILAGGESSRFGSDKALASTPRGPLASRALTALREAGMDPVVLVGGSAELSASLAIPSIPDRLPGEGPLAGLGTALSWASGVARIVVLPCDMPAVSAEVVRALVAAGTNNVAAVASVDGKPHPIVGCWPTQWTSTVWKQIRSGQRRMSDVLDAGPYALVEFDPGTLVDADDPVELKRLLAAEPPLD